MKSVRWMALGAAMALAACGGDGDGITGPGNGKAAFTADVAGDVQTSVKGDAKLGTWTPKTGSYPLNGAVNVNPGDGDWIATAYDSDPGQVTTRFAATSGTVKIIGVSEGKLQGSFSSGTME